MSSAGLGSTRALAGAGLSCLWRRVDCSSWTLGRHAEMTSKSDCILRTDRESKPPQNILAPHPIDGRGRSYPRGEIEVSHCPPGQSLAFSGAASGDKSVIRAGGALDAKTFLAIRRKAALEGCKWDIQVGDVTTLASFPLIINRSVWDQLARWAEHLAEEA